MFCYSRSRAQKSKKIGSWSTNNDDLTTMKIPMNDLYAHIAAEALEEDEFQFFESKAATLNQPLDSNSQ